MTRRHDNVCLGHLAYRDISILLAFNFVIGSLVCHLYLSSGTGFIPEDVDLWVFHHLIYYVQLASIYFPRRQQRSASP